MIVPSCLILRTECYVYAGSTVAVKLESVATRTALVKDVQNVPIKHSRTFNLMILIEMLLSFKIKLNIFVREINILF